MTRKNVQRFSLLVTVFALISLFTLCTAPIIRSKHSIARDPNWSTLSLGENALRITAFSTVIIQEIAQEERLPLQIVDTDQTKLYQGLKNGDYAAAFSDLSPTIQTTQEYSFSNPFLVLGPVLVVRSDAKISSLENLTCRIVGINQFDDTFLIVQKYPCIIIQLYQNMPKALQDLVDGKVDGVLLNNLDAQALVSARFSGKLKIATEPLSDQALRLITLKGQNEEIIKGFNQGLETLHQSGQFQELSNRFLMIHDQDATLHKACCP